MNTSEFLVYLRRQDIQITYDEGNLRVNSPKGALTVALKKELAARKPDIIEFLKTAERTARPSPGLSAMPRNGRLPLSPAQRQLWQLMQLFPDSAAYNMHLAFRARGRLDAAALARSIEIIVGRHEILRARFPAGEGDEPSLVIGPPETCRLKISDESSLDKESRDSYAQKKARREAETPFNLAAGPLLRTELVRFADDHHLLLITMHHIISDGWSFDIFLRELNEIYQALLETGQVPGTARPLQYVDFASWQQLWLESEASATHREFWRTHLSGDVQAPVLPAPHPGSRTNQSAGAFIAYEIDPAQGRQLRQVSQQNGTTLFQTLFTVFNIWLSRYAGQTDLVVCTPVACRTREEIVSMIGYFNNTLVLRTQLDTSLSFEETLANVQPTLDQAFAYQELPFTEVARLDNLRRVPLSRAMFALQNGSAEQLSLPGVEIRSIPAKSGMVQYDLSLTLVEEKDRLCGDFGFKSEIFDAESMARLAEEYQQTLTLLLEQPDTRLSELPRFPYQADVRARAQKAHLAPRNELESQLVQIWEQIFEVSPIGIDDNFFDLGGHSLLALRLFARIRSETGINLPLATLFDSNSIASMAKLIQESGPRMKWSSLVPIQSEGSKPPFFCIHGLTGDILWFRRLGELMGDDDRPFYGLQAQGLDGVQSPFDDIPSMAALYVQLMESRQPEGPYYFGGASLGGTVALEMARQLRDAGKEIGLLVMFDHAPLLPGQGRSALETLTRLKRLLLNSPYWISATLERGLGPLFLRVKRKVRAGSRKIGKRIGISAPAQVEAADLLDYGADLSDVRKKLIEAHWRAIYDYRSQSYRGDVLLLQARAQPLLSLNPPDMTWKTLAEGGYSMEIVPGSHEGMFMEPHVHVLAGVLQKYLNRQSSNE